MTKRLEQTLKERNYYRFTTGYIAVVVTLILLSRVMGWGNASCS